MEQLSSPTLARSVDEQVDMKHDMQSNAFLCIDSDSSAAEGPAASLLECARDLLYLGRGEGNGLIDQLLSIFQRGHFGISPFIGCVQLGSIALRLYPAEAMAM